MLAMQEQHCNSAKNSVCPVRAHIDTPQLTNGSDTAGSSVGANTKGFQAKTSSHVCEVSVAHTT
jgi:hypothetical protein